MKQLQVTVPKKLKEDAREIIKKFSSDIESSEVEKDGDGRKKRIEFRVTVKSEQIDELTKKLKAIENLESGDLTIRVMQQESLIRKGQETQGSSSMLSQEELYSHAKESADFNRAEWSLVGISAIIATYGLAADNLIVVIGAMMVAPILSPFISGALSVAVGDRRLFEKSLATGIGSAVLAVAAASIAAAPFAISWNETLALVSSPNLFSILLAVSVGVAASLTFVTGLRDEIAGVAVAIALIPPIASAGIGIRLLDPQLVLNSLTVVSVNILSILAAGFACFRLIGVKPETYYKKKQAQQMQYLLPLAILFLLVLSASVMLTAPSEDTMTAESFGEQFFGDQLLEHRVIEGTDVYYVVGEFNRTEFDRMKPESGSFSVVELESAD